MNKTKIESSIMEMIEPKANDIQQRFSRGEKLSLQDFNLLLLKSQYNHLNHVDNKLDLVTADVASLKDEFCSLRDEINIKFENFKVESNLKFDNFINEINLRFDNFRDGINLKFDNFRGEINLEFRNHSNDIIFKLENFKKEIDNNIQKAIKVNMRWSIGMMAFIVTFLKVIDMIIK